MARQAWLYERGQWSAIEDLIEAAWPESGGMTFEQEYKKAIEDAGYTSQYLRTLGKQTPDSIIVLLANTTAPIAPYPFAIEIPGLNSERIYCVDLPSFLEITYKLRLLDFQGYSFKEH